MHSVPFIDLYTLFPCVLCFSNMLLCFSNVFYFFMKSNKTVLREFSVLRDFSCGAREPVNGVHREVDIQCKQHSKIYATCDCRLLKRK